MPSKSDPQARLMAACAHGADYDKCPPAAVSTEFNQADKGARRLSHAMRMNRFGKSKHGVSHMKHIEHSRSGR